MNFSKALILIMINWKKYSRSFRRSAKIKGLTSKQIIKLLHYARNLNEKNLPIIYDVTHFSLLVGYDIEYVLGASNNSIKFYRTFYIPKKSTNRKRKIDEPLPSLKEIQKWILINILNNIRVSKFAKAFVSNISLKDNAKFHRNQKLLLTLDIKDFFKSIKFIEVYKVFHKIGYSKGVSVLLSKLCTFYGSLPQGAPTSPYISNLVFHPLDNRIAAFCFERNIRYTRYADDLTFSGDFKPGMIIKFVKYVLKNKKLKLNSDKIRTMYKGQRQEVTGIIVNQKMQVPRKIRRELRQNVYYIKKYDVLSHMERKKIMNINYLNHLLGKANFICFINPKDSKAKDEYNYLKNKISAAHQEFPPDS